MFDLYVYFIADINECRKGDNGSPVCTGENIFCRNRPGSYSCHAKKGYVIEYGKAVGE